MLNNNESTENGKKKYLVKFTTLNPGDKLLPFAQRDLIENAEKLEGIEILDGKLFTDEIKIKKLYMSFKVDKTIFRNPSEIKGDIFRYGLIIMNEETGEQVKI